MSHGISDTSRVSTFAKQSEMKHIGNYLNILFTLLFWIIVCFMLEFEPKFKVLN